MIDAHWDGQSYQFNDVTFVYDARADPARSVGVLGTFAELYAPVPLREVAFLGEPTGLWAVTIRVPKGQTHVYRYTVDGTLRTDPINPQRELRDNGAEWSRFFTDGCAIPILFERWEWQLLERLINTLLPFQVAENRRFLAETYNRLDRSARDGQFPFAYRLDEAIGTVNFIDKLLARREAHNLSSYRVCLRQIDRILRDRHPDQEPSELGRQVYVDLYDELAANAVAGWDHSAYADPSYFLLLLRRHAMTGAFAHPKHGGNAGAAGWAYLSERFPFDWANAVEAPLGRNTDYRG
ncbi:gluconate 2-dehydrogenase subunit 3 family protein [Cryptosporangium aurantiacum]|uniref:gluconate 2-dehydrogenase subunit 3 family protein n=1 Tax=Cryptosporangium aurantiacum TaxID=134849 RepID=UPI001C4A47D2|nr:gluconate 2-dehydrogenase subunit 3 family protein [Cryptosporangium aurantiacum]